MKFDFFSPPQLYFGAGTLKLLPDLLQKYGRQILLLTGRKSFNDSFYCAELLKRIEKAGIKLNIETIGNEPSPADIDAIVAACYEKNINAVAAIGGGSVIDAGKAVSAMMLKNEPVVNYLEGVGTQEHDGVKLPFIAVPTTAGTGSEATKNAVISQTGRDGFKKSLRHDNFVPDAAIIDPELTLACPPPITAACGMDALTQLIESLVSTKASPVTDSLAYGALDVLKDALIRLQNDPFSIALRSAVSYAAYISGLTLANAGLGAVHGFASVIGGRFHIPHGIVCGTLLAPVTRRTIEILLQTEPDHPSLEKYARAASLLSDENKFRTSADGAELLADLLDRWSNILKMPGLSKFGIKKTHLRSIADNTGCKNNPCLLSKEQLEKILFSRL